MGTELWMFSYSLKDGLLSWHVTLNTFSGRLLLIQLLSSLSWNIYTARQSLNWEIISSLNTGCLSFICKISAHFVKPRNFKLLFSIEFSYTFFRDKIIINCNVKKFFARATFFSVEYGQVFVIKIKCKYVCNKEIGLKKIKCFLEIGKNHRAYLLLPRAFFQIFKSLPNVSVVSYILYNKSILVLQKEVTETSMHLAI